MRGFTNMRLRGDTRLSRQVGYQQGFTLVTIVVVIGFIVALAAVIVPWAIQLADDGAEAAKNAEWDAIQTSLRSPAPTSSTPWTGMRVLAPRLCQHTQGTPTLISATNGQLRVG